MFKILSYIIIVLAINTASGFYMPAFADDDLFREQEELLLELINRARANPLAAARSLGLNTDKILEDLPEIADILVNGLPPFTYNGNLYLAAAAHNNDMLENSFYSSISLNGLTPEERILNNGYMPKNTGESLGMLGFSNFVEAEDAARIIFSNMFKDELDAKRDRQRNILNPDLKEAGISIGSGAFHFGVSSFNVYLVTCDFALSAAEELEFELISLINQIRQDPLAAAVSIGINTDRIISESNELGNILTNGLPPLSFNDRLYASARGHADDMLEKNYFSYESLDGRSIEDRIIEKGYDPLVSGEIIGSVLTVSGLDPFDIGKLIIFNHFRNELDLSNDYPSVILNPEFKEIGLAFISVDSEEQVKDDQLTSKYNLFVCDFGDRI
ncbi:MAG TPA: CAP domain-containing protein [Desulfobacteraceae bacterium]|nr:CAP domain-containing protein [Desulfobacteraceae bacterium]